MHSACPDLGVFGTTPIVAGGIPLDISNNLPFDKIAKFFTHVCHSLIIEFIPKTDSQVQVLLASREDIFTDYTKEQFEVSFSKYFSIENSTDIQNSERTLYLMQKKK